MVQDSKQKEGKVNFSRYFKQEPLSQLERFFLVTASECVSQMVTQTFGDILFCPESEHLVEFPSPESLKRQIIISTKPPKEYLESESITENDNGSNKVKDSSEEGSWGKEVPDMKDRLESFDKVPC